MTLISHIIPGVETYPNDSVYKGQFASGMRHGWGEYNDASTGRCYRGSWVRCSVLQCVAVCRSVLHRGAVCYSALKCVAVCCSVVWRV